MILLILYYAFFTAGLFAFGGGLAIIPFLSNMSDTYHWFTQDDLTTLIALSEMTPGAIGINMATYAGFLSAGLPGAVMATVGLVTPSIILVCLLSRIWNKIKDMPMVVSAFNAVKAAIAGLISAIFIMLFLSLFQGDNDFIYTIKVLILFVIGLGLLHIKNVHMAVYLIFMGCFGILFGF